MARDRKLTTFNQVANINKNNNVNNDVNKNNNDDTYINKNNDVNVNDDLMGALKSLADNSKRKGTGAMSKPTGIYFEENVLTVLKKLSKNGGRGSQSKIVNDATKAAFIQAGLLDSEGNIKND